MKDKRFLIASTGFVPYLTDFPYMELAFRLAKSIHAAGGQVRMFMPKFGVINERKLQLHEVIRLSGINIVVDDEDIPLTIKVSSIPKERMQVYFIDSLEWFHGKMFLLNEEGRLRDDLTDFMIFFAKSVVETAKKLNWNADYIINMGWFTSLLPLYLKTYYKDEPLFSHTQTMHILVNDLKFDGTLPGQLEKKLEFDDILPEEYGVYLPPDYAHLFDGASHYADYLMMGEDEPDDVIRNIYNKHHKIKGKITRSLLEENPRIFAEILKQFQTLDQ